MAKEHPIEIFMLPNVLKAKAGKSTADGEKAAIARAEAALESLKKEFKTVAGKDIDRLTECLKPFAHDPEHDDRLATIEARSAG